MNVMPIRMLSCSKCQWENKPTNTTKGHDVDDTAVERSALLSIHLFISPCFLAFCLCGYLGQMLFSMLHVYRTMYTVYLFVLLLGLP